MADKLTPGQEAQILWMLADVFNTTGDWLSALRDEAARREAEDKPAPADDLVARSQALLNATRLGDAVRGPYAAMIEEMRDRIEAQAREIDRLTRSRDGWEADAGREIQNRDFWKARADRLAADVAELVALVRELRGWVELADDQGRDTAPTLARVDTLLAKHKGGA